MAGELTFQQLTGTQTILRTVSRIPSTTTLFQDYLGLRPGSGATERVMGRDVGWDIFDNTRTIAKGRAPGAGPSSTPRKNVGHVSATCMRLHEKTNILSAEVFKTRPLGSQIGNVEVIGQNYIARQVAYMARRMFNAREFMLSRMFRGGFSIIVDGDDHYLDELGASGGTDVNFQIPATHLTKLDMGTGSDILDVSWDDTSADIIGQLLKLDTASEIESGYPLRDIFLNGNTAANLFNNTKLQAAGGSSMTIFKSLSASQIKSAEGIPDTGYDVVFRALPLHRFHVYNGVLRVGAGSEYDSVTHADLSFTIPDKYAVFLPRPSSEWVGYAEGSEVVRENLMAIEKHVYGFHPWSTAVIDPPGRETKMLDNGLPVLYVPKAVAYGNVVY